jgi:hypothetical protein
MTKIFTHEAASVGGTTSSPGMKMLTWLASAVLFFGLVTPIGIIMRLAGRDRLHLRSNPTRASYWITRPPTAERPIAMTRQT